MGDKQCSNTVKAYWKPKNLLVPFKITERGYQIKHIKCYLTTSMRWTKLIYSENERKDDQELFLYNDANENITNAILDSPFTSEEIVKGTTLLKSKNASAPDSISNKMIKASLLSFSSF